MPDLEPTRFTPKQYRALRDMNDGHLTLYASVQYFDPNTGAELTEPQLLYIGHDRYDVPLDWWKPFHAAGFIAFPACGQGIPLHCDRGWPGLARRTRHHHEGLITMQLEITAADLADGSVVADHRRAFIKTHPTVDAPWRGTDGGYHFNRTVDEALANGAVVLRHGTGEEVEV